MNEPPSDLIIGMFLGLLIVLVLGMGVAMCNRLDGEADRTCLKWSTP